MEWEALKATIDGSLEKSKVFFCLATLEYLQRAGGSGWWFPGGQRPGVKAHHLL